MKRRYTLTIVPLLVSAFFAAVFAAGEIRIDGSSTVYPISLAIAEEFGIEQPEVAVTVAFSGTGGGFSKLCAGETDINDASRVVKESELEACAANGIELIEIPVAADAITMVVNPANDWLSCITADQLHQIWAPDSRVSLWSDVDPGWPQQDIVLYGPGTDSGTFDYFTEAINGESGAVRTDFFPSEDDNVLALGVEGDAYALGYFGYAYYASDQDRLKALSVDGGDGCVAPSAQTIASNSYTPLSRPLFIYVSVAAMEREPAIQDFVRFYLDEGSRELIEDTGYATYGPDIYTVSMERLAARVTGTSFADFQAGDSVLEAVRKAH